MKPAAIFLAGLMLATASPATGQARIGELRLLGVAGLALAPNRADEPPDFPPPSQGTVGGLSGSLSFMYRNFSLGPEAMVLRGSQRRMYELGAVARWSVGNGVVRPFVLAGGGVYSWDRKMVLPFNPSGIPTWVGELTYLTGNVGGGLVLGTHSVALVLEVRAHKSLARKEDFGSRDMLSFSGGGRVSW